jgi:CBS domain-containing protein
MTTSPSADHSGDPGTGMFADATDERYHSALRYLGAIADADTTDHDPTPDPSFGPELVRHVMVPGVVAAHEGAVFKEIVDALVRNHISAVPVVNAQRQVVGVVSESDLLARVSKGRLPRPRGHRFSAHSESQRKLHAATAGELMTSPAVTTTPDTHIADAARKAAHHRVRRLPVVNDDGVLVGIVTRGDLLRPFLRPDDEIRADIKSNVVLTAMVLNPFSVDVDVIDGVVKLRGHFERKGVAYGLAQACRGVGGVVDVDASALTYEVDDLLTPSPGSVAY